MSRGLGDVYKRQDPGASEANQLNRIKLMIAAAKKAHKAKFADGDEPQGFTAAD